MTGPWSSLGGTGPIGDDMAEVAEISCAVESSFEQKKKALLKEDALQRGILMFWSTRSSSQVQYWDTGTTSSLMSGE
jgi:hypothetical protein